MTIAIKIQIRGDPGTFMFDSNHYCAVLSKIFVQSVPYTVFATSSKTYDCDVCYNLVDTYLCSAHPPSRIRGQV